MENSTQNSQNNPNLMLPSGNKKSKYWKFVIAFLVVIILAGGGFFVWNKYLSPQAKSNRETQKNYEKYLAWEENYKKAMTEDVYGGKTPEETLQMFIEALKKEDVELASKYFALNTNENSEYYLTRREWEEGLKKAKEEGKLEEIVSKIEQTKPTSYFESYSWYKKSFSFESLNKDGVVEILIELGLSPFSGVWKIISL